jgi:hypothetical protein
VPVAGHDLIGGYPVLLPGFALGPVIVQHRLEAIQGGGVLGFRCLASLKFLPDGPQFGGLIGRQQTKYAIRGGVLPFRLVHRPGVIVNERVAGVDFHQVVDQHHLQHP